MLSILGLVGFGLELGTAATISRLAPSRPFAALPDDVDVRAAIAQVAETHSPRGGALAGWSLDLRAARA